jgi:hypothetical protein
MSSDEQVREIIAEAGGQLGAPDLALDDHGCAELALGDVPVTLMLAQQPERLLWLYADLGDVPDEPGLLCGLLRLGFLGWASGQLTLGLDSAGQRMIGYSVVPVATLSTGSLRTALLRLKEGAEGIRDRLAYRDFDVGDAAPAAG